MVGSGNCGTLLVAVVCDGSTMWGKETMSDRFLHAVSWLLRLDPIERNVATAAIAADVARGQAGTAARAWGTFAVITAHRTNGVAHAETGAAHGKAASGAAITNVTFHR
jgi:hypothetical protein